MGVVFVRAIGLMKNLKKEGKSKGLARKSLKRKMGRNPRKTLPSREKKNGGNEEASRTQKCRKYKQSQAVTRAIQ